MAYFTIMSGLRGCYMPDSVTVYKVETRRELKSILEDQARYAGEGFKGLSKRAIAWAAAKAWRDRKGRSIYASAILPYGPGKDRPYSIEICNATREEFKEQESSL